MPTRAMWKAVVELGSLRIPVKLYAAVEDRGIHFRLLHGKDGVPVEQRMVHPVTGAVVGNEDVKKGVEIRPGVFSLVTDEEVETLRPEASRTIEVTQVVSRDAVPDRWYDRPYFVGPDGDADDTYFALASHLRENELQGIAHWVMRAKSYFGSLHAVGDHLGLVTLRSRDEVITPARLTAPEGRALSKKEVQMAEELVALLEDDFRPGDFRNEHRDRLRELIEARASGSKFSISKLRSKKPTDDLSEALSRSRAAASKERKRAS